MNGFLKKLTKDRIIRYGSIFSVILLLFDCLYVAYFYRRLPPFLPLFNQMPWGEMRLGDKPVIFLPVGLAFGLTLLNVFFSTQLYDEMPLLSRMVTITSVLINIITFIFLLRVTQLVV